jgi:hypothetical protein
LRGCESVGGARRARTVEVHLRQDSLQIFLILLGKPLVSNMSSNRIDGMELGDRAADERDERSELDLVLDKLNDSSTVAQVFGADLPVVSR